MGTQTATNLDLRAIFVQVHNSNVHELQTICSQIDAPFAAIKYERQ